MHDIHGRHRICRLAAPAFHGSSAVINRILVNFNSHVTAGRTQYLRYDARQVASATAKVQEAERRARRQLESFHDTAINMRGRNMNVAFFEGLVRMGQILSILVICKRRIVWVSSSTLEHSSGKSATSKAETMAPNHTYLRDKEPAVYMAKAFLNSRAMNNAKACCEK